MGFRKRIWGKEGTKRTQFFIRHGSTRATGQAVGNSGQQNFLIERHQGPGLTHYLRQGGGKETSN